MFDVFDVLMWFVSASCPHIASARNGGGCWRISMEENEKVTFIIETFRLLKICSHSHRNSKDLNYIFIKRRCENYMFCKPRGLTLRSSYTLRVTSDSGTIEVEVSKSTTFVLRKKHFGREIISSLFPLHQKTCLTSFNTSTKLILYTFSWQGCQMLHLPFYVRWIRYPKESMWT